MRTGKRRIRDGHEYERFYNRASGENITVEKEASLVDTIKWIKIVVDQTLHQTTKIAQHLQGNNVRETCRRIWNFCFYHFQYEKDEARKEQLRTPNRAWMDRKTSKGIDCDCFTITICSMLKNLNIPFLMRITKYPNDKDFSHIYPVALTEEGEIIIDCVLYQFDKEANYVEKKDIEMELEILNGIPKSFTNDLPIDALDLFMDEDGELEGLDGKAERMARRNKRKKRRAENKNTPIKERLKKGFHVINKFNPATALLRVGVLASMKLNVFKVASFLRFGFWTDTEARRNSMDLNKLNQLKRIREKLEKIYFTAGGDPKSLRKAILSGKGNKNRMVQLNGLGSFERSVNDNDSLRAILGDELFYEELDTEMLNGLGSLGEPMTAGAAIAAASGLMATLKGMINKLGELFKKGSKAAEMFKIQDNTNNAEEKKRKFSFKNIGQKIADKIQQRKARKNQGSEVVIFDKETDNIAEDDYEIIPEDEFILQDPFNETQTTLPTFYNDNDADGSVETTTTDPTIMTSSDEESENGFVKWIKDNKVGIGIGMGALVVGGTTLAIYLNKKKKSKPKNGLAGVKKSKKNTTKPNIKKRKSLKIQPLL